MSVHLLRKGGGDKNRQDPRAGDSVWIKLRPGCRHPVRRIAYATFVSLSSTLTSVETPGSCMVMP